MESAAVSNHDADWPSRAPADDVRVEIFRRLVKAVRHNRTDEIKASFRQIVSSYRRGGDVARLNRIFTQAERLDLFLELLLSEAGTFKSAPLIGETLMLASRLGRDDEARQWLERRRRTRDAEIMVWSNADYLRRLVERQPDLVAALRALKYPDLPPLQSAPDLIRYAETVADRIAIEPAFLDRMYHCSKFPLARDAWEKRVKTAFAIDHITADNDMEPGWQIVLDPAAARESLSRLDPQRGTLLLDMHGGFVELLMAWLIEAFPDVLVTANEQRRARERNAELVFAGDDSRATLFALYKALGQRRAVLMAADAPLGALNASISVLGVTKPVPQGAAFLAYETGCNTAWCAVEREGDRFAPRLAIFPGHGQTEPYPDFKKRFFEFYASQIESLLTGSPDSLAIRPVWVNAFERAAA